MRTRRAIGDLDAVRDWTETRYGAKSWSGPRRVAARIEATRQGLDIRYVVTNIGGGTAWWLYECLYCARGQAENLIKLHKTQLASDRTSCRSPLANQMRLILHTAAYWLVLTTRAAIPRLHPLAKAEFATIRLRLFKLAARISETGTRVRIAFAAHARRPRCSANWQAQSGPACPEFAGRRAPANPIHFSNAFIRFQTTPR